MKRSFLFLFLFSFFWGYNQEESDEKYLEDQFYIGITYNLLLNRPAGVSQNNLPFGVQTGFIKDLPLNERRNIGIGIGLGYNFNSYFSNLQALEQDGDIVYQLLDGENAIPFNRNRISTHLIELPIEFRWRTSTPSSYKFWRIYGGVRLGYVFSAVSKFVSDTQRIRFNNNDVERFQYDLYVSMGYNTWNFYASLGLNNVLKDDIITTDGVPIEINALKIGLIFYIL